MISLVVNGVTFPYPENGDSNWGAGATNWASAITSGVLTLAGGSFPLTADIDFGTNFGIKALYLKTETANLSTSGVVRLAVADTIGWRNNANSGNLLLLPNGSDLLQFNSIALVNLSAAQTLTNKSMSGASNTFTSIPAGTALTGQTPIANGGTGQATANAGFNALSPMTTGGDFIYGGASGVATRLPNGNAGQVLTSAGTTLPPTWSAGSAGTVTSVTFTGDGTLLSSTPSSAVTTSGTLTASLKTQTAGTFLAGPTSGSAANPTFRALQAPTIQKFISGSGTYTTPAGVLYIRVLMVGAGGGGSGSATAAANNAGDGGDGSGTTFGTSLLIANGGNHGVHGLGSPGTGGTASLGSGPIGTALTGGTGGTFVTGSLSTGLGNGPGGDGGQSALGGAGLGNASTGQSTAGIANTGGGGAGGQFNFSVANGASHAGTGGGAGAFINALISSPAATYAYLVGVGGAGGGAGTSGNAGSAGGSGYIEVTEYYQ